jgi:two-component sensor histidine kinase
MASAPSDPTPILGRVNDQGRLVAADPELERLQVEAGSRVGASLAIPQLAAVVRIAQRLGIPVSRRVLAAGREQDVDMWVRAVPEADGTALSIERWSVRPASPPRLAAIASVEHEKLEAEALAWAVDEHLRFLDLAAPLAELLGLDPCDAVGQPLTRLFRLEQGNEGEMPLLDAVASREDFVGQAVEVRDGGQEMILSGKVALDDSGSFAGFHGTAAADGSLPVKPRPALDKAIQTALRSPLDRIVQSAEEMSAEPDSAASDEYTAYAADIATAARHLLSVIRSLGEQSETGGASQVELMELVSEAVGLVESAARERGILIGVQPTEALLARGESRSVIQILVNLIGNAVRYSRQNSAVTISFEQSSNAVMVHVADEGPGIDPSDHERIFQPFQKGTEAGEGSGLGLAIARRLARAMGGDVQLDSAVGRGARFTLVLATV